MNIPKATAIPILEPIKTDSFKMDDDFFKKIKTPLIYGTFGIVLLVLICIIIGLIYSNSGLSGGGQLSGEQHATTWIIIAFISAILLIVFMVIPNYKEFLNFLGKLKFVLLLVAYIIGLIILYRSVPSGIVNAYAFLFFPITMLIGIYLFYLAMEKGQLFGFDLNYERVKYALIFFCLIAFMLVFYTVDPGGYLKTYFGPSLVITILLAIFGFLYLLTLMTLPSIKQGQGNSSGEQGGFFKGLSKMALFSGVAFIIFLIIVVSGILAYPGGFTKGTNIVGSYKTNTVSLIAILVIVIFVLWILFFGILSFSDIKLRDSDGDIDKSMSNISNIARRVFMLLFGLVFSGLLIGWLVTGVESLSSKSGIISFILNALIVITVLGLVFKLITGGTYYKKSALFRLVVNTLLYIPCVLVSIIDSIVSIFGLGVPSAKTGVSILSATKNTPYTYYILLFLIILLYAVYYVIAPQFQTNMAKQGGTILVNAPIYTNTENVIGTYDNLNGTNADTNPYDYQYAISFWVFIDAVSPNVSSSLEKYTSLLNYGDKPNVLYNASENTLMITMLNTGEPAIGSVSRLKNPQELDANGNIIIYKMSNVLLQKWNNIIINYNGGTLDIFYNGKLVKSVNEVVPRMSKDVLTVGSNKGVNGGICNVNYFNTNLSASQVYYLYDTVKDKTPPVASSSRESIVKDVLAGANIKSNPPVITFPITIDVKSQASSQEAVPDQPPAKGDPNKTFTDYLSFKWFAVANNDNFNGL
jgi:Concanavalin A-like lectin/glucanases superfamily